MKIRLIQLKNDTKLLAGWGIFSASILMVCTFTIIIFPGFEKVLMPGCYVPIFVYEVTLVFWPLLKELSFPSLNLEF